MSEAQAQEPTHDASEESKKLSKGQKKKAKAKGKQEEQKDVGAPEVQADLDQAKGAPAAGAGGKKGKKPMNAAAKLAQERLKQKQADEELQRKEEEEERKRQEEEERKQKEEEEAKRREEEEKRRIKKMKKEELKAQGKWLSKKEKAKRDEAEKLRQELIDQGVIKVEVEENKQEEENQDSKKSKVIKNKKGKKKADKEDGHPADDHDDSHPDPVPNSSELPAATTKAVPSDEKEVQITTSSKPEKEEEEEEEEVADNWDEEDIDEMANKIADKDLKAVSGTVIKPVKKEDEEDEEEDEKEFKVKEKARGGKYQQKVKEEAKGGDGGSSLFDRVNPTKQYQKKAAPAKPAPKAAKKASNKLDLRCPIICVLGHVDTGKTLILDKLRRTNVQAGEAGGITQQIGATYFPEDTLRDHLTKLKGKIDLELQVPGFLVIDTPGHESFTNLRSRGSNLCDIAILVVDLMHGLENQTLESMRLLKQKNTPFVVALNKIDRNYGWKPTPYNDVRGSLQQQEQATINEFEQRVQKTIVAFAEQEINAALYWENQDENDYVSLCPTSAITGEGLPDLMTYIVKQCQERHAKKLARKDEFECTVLEVKVIEGLGTTIDVILVNGVLKVGDTIVLSGFNGPIQTTIRALLTPQPLKEMRVKGEYIHHQSITGAMGIKISAPNLEQALAGSELLRARNEDELQEAIDRIQSDLSDIVEKYVDKHKQGVCVQASTLGSLEALLEFLKSQKIPVCSINIGPVHKKDILKAMKSLTGEIQRKEFASILAFDVKVTQEAQEFADENEIKIFTAEIIYRLFDEFCDYVKKCVEERKSSEGTKAVFPCILEIVKDGVFNQKNPIVMGVNVKAGFLKVGTPLCVPDKGNLRIGHVTSIELNKKPIPIARAAQGSVAIKIEGDSSIQVNRHFDTTNQIASWMTRDSIDALKQYFKDDLTKDDWRVVLQLKKMYGIP